MWCDMGTTDADRIPTCETQAVDWQAHVASVFSANASCAEDEDCTTDEMTLECPDKYVVYGSCPQAVAVERLQFAINELASGVAVYCAGALGGCRVDPASCPDSSPRCFNTQCVLE